MLRRPRGCEIQLPTWSSAVAIAGTVTPNKTASKRLEMLLIRSMIDPYQ
jgi:hypothetical protein